MSNELFEIPAPIVEKIKASTDRPVQEQAVILIEEALAMRADETPAWRREIVRDRSKYSGC